MRNEEEGTSAVSPWLVLVIVRDCVLCKVGCEAGETYEHRPTSVIQCQCRASGLRRYQMSISPLATWLRSIVNIFRQTIKHPSNTTRVH